MSNNRDVLRIVTVGHVDHGKSTVIGRLLYDTKSIADGVVERVRGVCAEKGKSFEYAYLLDALEEEQKQGITIDTTQLQFHTEKRDYVIIDAPGHKEFLKNMISGAASAEAALLIIDSNEGIQEQSKRHGYILSLLGIEQVYVVVNKMDLIDYSEEKFNSIKEDMGSFLEGLNVRPKKFIPISAFYGDNLSSASEKMPWYTGETVLEALDSFNKEKGLEEKELRFPIQDVYKFDDRRIIVGRIEAGKLAVGDDILILPSGKTTKVKTIEYFAERDNQKEVRAGQSVGITVEDEFFNKRGEIITHLNSEALTSNVINANIIWMGKTPLVKNKKYKIKLVTQEIECEIAEINKVIDASSLGYVVNGEEVKINDVAEITIKTKEKLVFDKFSNNQNTGRFVLVDGFDVSGGGIVSGYEETNDVTAPTLVFNNEEVRLEVFDEYYFVVPGGEIIKEVGQLNKYNLGENIPFKGYTYNYGENFNIVDLENGFVFEIVEGKFSKASTVDSFIFNQFAFVNTKGFSIKIQNEEDLKTYINEHDNLTTLNHKYINFANKWLEFKSFRNIGYKEG